MEKYPLAFLTGAGCLFMKHSTETSSDGTPRYISNPNASTTYALSVCMKDYVPLYEQFHVDVLKELDKYPKSTEKIYTRKQTIDLIHKALLATGGIGEDDIKLLIHLDCGATSIEVDGADLERWIEKNV